MNVKVLQNLQDFEAGKIEKLFCYVYKTLLLFLNENFHQ